MTDQTLLEQFAARIDPKDAAWFDLCDLVAERVANLLHDRGWSQRTLARHLGKSESYVSRLLAGGQNLTLRTLAELEVAFGEPIVLTPPQVKRLIEDGKFQGLLSSSGRYEDVPEHSGTLGSSEAPPLARHHRSEHGLDTSGVSPAGRLRSR